MNQIKEYLKEGVSISDVLKNLREREKDFCKNIPWRERGTMIRTLFPDIYKAQTENAEQAFRGIAVLPGCSEPHFIGNPVRWHENLFNDAEYTYQLNRMDHWRTLLEGYSLTGDERYAKKVIDEFYDWVDNCPCQPMYRESGELAVEDFDGCGCNQGIWRSLEVGIRMYRTWPHIIHHLIGTPFIDEKFLETYLTSVYQHALILHRIPPVLWPMADHNHYLMENNGLLYLSCMFPEFKNSDAWKQQAIHELERSIQVQVTSNGGQIEGCASYHNGCIYWFVLPILLSKKYNFTVSVQYIQRLKQMLEYSVHMTRPDGSNCSWGDSNTYTGTLSWGALCYYLAFEDSTYMQYARNFYSYEDLTRAASNYAWEVSDLSHLHDALGELKEHAVPPALPHLSWQKDLKQVFLRTDWSQNALSLMFACRTPIQNQHAHMDPAGFDFTAYGRPLLVDPGIFCYRDDDDRRLFKSVHWHNCLTLNGKDPWEYISSWAYGKQQPGSILHAEESERLIYAVAEHLNYQPASHKRVVALVDKRFLLVLDLLDHVEQDSSVQINFHIDSPTVMADAANSFVTSLSDEANIGIYSDTQLKPMLLPARRSTRNDVAHDTLIARFFTKHLTAGLHGFVTIACPTPAGQAALKITDIHKALETDGSFKVSFTLEEQNYKLTFLDDRLIIQ